ncbi:MAG TPA: LytTR family DNA-binding domain-containing protein [Bacteroidales bacterium]|nr:LytTR family DNA-binding domain-containing protein [Bacteroidales bacterium]
MGYPKGQTLKASCVIVDDEQQATSMMTKLLSAHSYLKIADVVNDSKQALVSILHHKPDLVFMDIQMPGMDGFEITEALSHTSERPFIIYVTAYDKFAIKAIKASAFDYLLKPVNETDLALTMERFMEQYLIKQHKVEYTVLLEQALGKKIKFNTSGGFILINPHDILFIKADWNYCEIYTGNEKPELITMNIGSFEETLPKSCFARINRSTIINLAYLERVNRLKRICILKKDNKKYEFKIPILRIRELEKWLN